MQIIKTIQDTVAILKLKGPVVAEELESIDQVVMECAEQGIFRLVFDLDSVPFIDSMGLEMLQDTSSALSRSGGEMRLASLNDVCFDILLATRMHSFVYISKDADEAVRSLL